MVYASSKDSLRRSLVGVQVDVQATAADEVTYEGGESCRPVDFHITASHCICNFLPVLEKCDRLR